MTEMDKLEQMLELANIPYEVRMMNPRMFGDNVKQIAYPSFDNRICDAVCHWFSYGYEDGLLEIMGLVDVESLHDTVEGWLTASEVFNRIQIHYLSTKEE